MRRRELGVLLGLLGLLCLLAAGRNVAPAPASPAATPSPPDAPRAPAAPRAQAAEPARVRVPRPSGRVPGGLSASRPGAPTPAAPVRDAAAAAPPSGMVDRRADAPADAAAVREALMDQMDVVKEAVLPCVAQWSAVEPGVAGAVTLGFALDADGLTDVWIQDHAAVPDALLSCFADAVYASDWAGISREPLQVTWPFKVSGDGDGPDAR